MTSENHKVHAVISGDVQGVGFRMFAKNTAEELHINGWVRNLWNGDVELIAEGNKQSLDLFLFRLHQGTRSAFVANISVEWMPFLNEFDTFQIRMSSR